MTIEEAKEIFINHGFIKVDHGDSVCTFFDGDKWREACFVISEWLKEEPRKGHWIVDGHKIHTFGSKNEYQTHDYSVHCDKCNYAWDYTTDKEGSLVSNFCPNCGADMREVEE